MMYYLQEGDGGPIKFGFVSKPDNLKPRLSSLGIGNFRPLNLVALDFAADKIEDKTIRRRFAAHLKGGEWFNASPEVFRHVEGLFLKLDGKSHKDSLYVDIGMYEVVEVTPPKATPQGDGNLIIRKRAYSIPRSSTPGCWACNYKQDLTFYRPRRLNRKTYEYGFGNAVRRTFWNAAERTAAYADGKALIDYRLSTGRRAAPFMDRVNGLLNVVTTPENQ